jgi:hypothetical protein
MVLNANFVWSMLTAYGICPVSVMEWRSGNSICAFNVWRSWPGCRRDANGVSLLLALDRDSVNVEDLAANGLETVGVTFATSESRDLGNGVAVEGGSIFLLTLGV